MMKNISMRFFSTSERRGLITLEKLKQKVKTPINIYLLIYILEFGKQTRRDLYCKFLF